VLNGLANVMAREILMSLNSWVQNRNAQLAAAALVIGALSYWLAHRYLSGQEAAARQRVAAQYATRDVVVAAADLDPGTALAANLLARRPMPQRFLASDAVAADAAAEVAGRRLQRALRSGEAVTASALEPISAPSLSSLIEPGLRAVTIPVDETSAAAGLLAPGDLIDLLLVTRSLDADSPAASVRPLLQAVRVVATGRQTERRHAQAREAGANETEPSFATVTLHVRPDDAQRILLAQRIGELAVVVRTPGDSTTGTAAAVDSAALLGGRTHAAARAAAAPQAIEFIIGGVGAATGARSRAGTMRRSGVQP
jgi:pilus assembly protein CpaB